MLNKYIQTEHLAKNASGEKGNMCHRRGTNKI
jgi:hypothetical protein